MKKFEIAIDRELINVWQEYYYTVEAETLEEAIEKINSGEVDEYECGFVNHEYSLPTGEEKIIDVKESTIQK